MAHPMRSFAEMRERLVNAINKANLRGSYAWSESFRHP